MVLEGDLLKETQNEYFNILKDFDILCRKNKLEYSIIYGTLLGAVRHKGFIPWDDDIDVVMHIDDINKLINIWDKVGDKEKYFLQTKKTNYYLTSLFVRLRKNGTTSVDVGFEDVPIHWGLPIDIFPVVNVPKTSFGEKRIGKIIFKANKISNEAFLNKLDEKKAKKSAYKTIKLIEKIKRISDKNSNSEKLMVLGVKRTRIIYRKDFYPLKNIPFEGYDFMTVNNYDAFLKSCYGDYMKIPPVEKQVHHEVGLFDLHKDFTEYTKHQMVGEY